MDPRDEALLLDRQLCFPLYACARKVTQAYTPFLKPLGLTYTQYLVMLVLWESDGLRVTELCERLYLDTGTLTPVLKKMEQAGLLDRRRSVQDERQVEVFLTQAGQDLKEQARNIPFQMARCMSMPQEDAANLYRILHDMLRHEPED